MPKEQITISTFQGFYPAADSRDLPDNAPSYVENVDFVAGEPGALMGLPQDTERISSGVNGGAIVVPIQDGDEYVYHDGSNVASLNISSFAAPSSLGGGSSSGVASLASDGEAVHVGMGPTSSNKPQWVGYIGFGQFGGSVPSGIQVEDAILDPLETGTNSIVMTRSAPSADENGAFKSDRRYFYKVSVVYDGFQESPLPVEPSTDSFSAEANTYPHLTLGVRINNFASLSQRISAVNVYRAEAVDGATEGPSTDYTLVKSIDINDDGWTTSLVTDKLFAFQDDYVQGRSYEAGTGIPETLEQMQLHYGLSTVSNGYHIIGRTWHPELKEITTYLFRSELERFDMFNWPTNHLRLPSEPVALVTYQGNVWAFCEGKTYVIDPSGFSILEEFEGIGAAGRRSVIVTDRGMFFASDRNIYWHDGNQVFPIGEPVFKSDEKAATGYLVRDASITPVMLYDSTRDLALVCFNGSDNANYAWAFHVGSKTWMTAVTLASGNIQGGFVSTDGKPFIIIGGKLFEVFASSSLRSWEWRSKEIHDGGLPFNVYHARIKDEPITGDSDVTLKYVEDGGSPATQASRTDKGGGIFEYVVNSDVTVPYGKVRNFQLQLTGDGNDRVKDVTLIWRRRTAR